MEEKVDEDSKPQRPVAGMRALGLGAFCAFGVFVIAIVIGMSSVLAGKKLILKASSDTPLDYSYEETSQELADAALKKITSFAEDAPGSGRLEFSLSLDELNSLVAYNEHFAPLKGSMKFDEIGKDLFAKFSYPVEKIDGLEEDGKGKFLNGRVRVAVYVKKREFKLQLQEVLQNGQALQIDSLNALQDRNLLSHFDIYNQTESQFNLVADVIFKDDRMFFRNWRDKYKK